MIPRMHRLADFSLAKAGSLVFLSFLAFEWSGRAPAGASSDPWTPAETVQPARFAEELAQEKDPFPTTIYVGVKTLYVGGHIPGAVFHGPGSTEQGLEDLKKFASSLPRNSDVVLYCGCCPLEKCPNLRPAFSALRGLGFARLRVLLLPISFNSDWAARGYPVRKGDAP